MITTRDCWWTRTRRSEVTEVQGVVTGAGLPTEVVEQAARLLGRKLSARPSGSDEYGEDLDIDGIATGATHDGCFIHLEPASPELKRALVEAVLDLHATFIGMSVDWSGVLAPVLERWLPGTTLRFRSSPRRRRLRIRTYLCRAGYLARNLAPVTDVDCSGGRAVLL